MKFPYYRGKRSCLHHKIIKELILFPSYRGKNPLASFNYVNFQTFKSILKPQSQQTKGNQRSCLVKTEMNYAF